jgi:small subunit ribosomal protein S21
VSLFVGYEPTYRRLDGEIREQQNAVSILFDDHIASTFLICVREVFLKSFCTGKDLMSVDVEVRGDIESALRFFKKQVQRDGILRELRRRQFYLKPSVKKKNKRLAAERKRRSAERRSPYR